MPIEQYTTTEISFSEGFYRGENMLLRMTRSWRSMGQVSLFSDISMFLGLDSNRPYDILVKRDGRELLLEEVPLKPQEYLTEIQTERELRLFPS